MHHVGARVQQHRRSIMGPKGSLLRKVGLTVRIRLAPAFSLYSIRFSREAGAGVDASQPRAVS
jgi:hypothetical protein